MIDHMEDEQNFPEDEQNFPEAEAEENFGDEYN